MADLRDIKDTRPNQDLIDQLEDMLAKAKDGKVRTMISVYGWDDDTWTHGWAMDERNSRRRMVGELSMVYFDVMTNVAIEDGDTVLSQAFNVE